MSTLINQIDNAETRFSKSQSLRELRVDELSKFERGEESDWRHLDNRARIGTRLERLGYYNEADAIMDNDVVPFNPLERILDANELSGIEFFERGVLAARSVARVQIRSAGGQVVGFGSGAMISPRLFMTNNHVISDAATAATSTVQFGYLDGIVGPRDPVTFAMDPSSFFRTDEPLDYTIVAIEPINADGRQINSRGWCPLIASSGKAIVGERVNIIQHPGGERMQVAVRDNTIIGVVDSFLHYRADTRPGSSGSPVFNDQWELAALHHAGKPKRNAQGKILMVDGQPWTGKKSDIPKIDWEANEGIRISEIVRSVNAVSLADGPKRLWDDTSSTPPAIDIWSLFENPSSDEALHTPENGQAVTQTTDEQGNPAWLFRLSFGPHTSGVIAPNKTYTPPKLSLPSTTPSTTIQPTLDSRSIARNTFERFRHDGPYYDKDTDSTARELYWESIDFSAASAELFPLLRDHLSTTHSGRHSYSRARHEFLYPAIDLHPDGSLKNIYSGASFSAEEAIAAEIEALVPFAEAIGVEISDLSTESILSNEALWDDLERSTELAFNCEHVVCQSWFDKRQPMKADIHHLFACQTGCNSFRSNIPYWQFDPTEEAERDACGRREGNNKFEPEHGKGAVARATMYFLMRYPGEIGDESNEFSKNRVKLLVDWHKEFPVGDYELHRNWLTEQAQGNRNPFIDYPDIATQALLERGFG